MAKPAYTIGKDEMLLITVRWNDGDTVLLETAVRSYMAWEIQDMIDANCTDNRQVVGVDLFDFVAKKGQSIADEFDIRTWKDRTNDDRRDQAEEEEQAVRVAYNAMRNSFNPIVHGAVIGRLEAAE